MNQADQHLRVLMTADAVGGVWSFALQLSGSMQSLNVDIVLAVMGPPPAPAQLWQAAALDNLHLEYLNVPLEWMDDPWAGVDEAGDWLMSLAARHDPQLVHFNGFVHASLDLHRPKLVTGHSCIWSWWRQVKGCDPPPRFAEYRRRVRAGLHAADAITAPTRTMLGWLEDLYGPLPQALSIYNGVDATTYVPGDKQPFVLSAGRFDDEGKNLALLLHAAEHIAWPCAIAGPAQASPAARNLCLLGKLDEAAMRSSMAAASIFAHPALYEPFGLAPLEAAASGCALVLADIPTLRELWEGAAVFADPTDASSFVNAVNNIIYASDQRRRLAQAARQRAEKLDARVTAHAYLDLYRRTIDHNVLPAPNGLALAEAGA